MRPERALVAVAIVVIAALRIFLPESVATSPHTVAPVDFYTATAIAHCPLGHVMAGIEATTHKVVLWDAVSNEKLAELGMPAFGELPMSIAADDVAEGFVLATSHRKLYRINPTGSSMVFLTTVGSGGPSSATNPVFVDANQQNGDIAAVDTSTSTLFLYSQSGQPLGSTSVNVSPIIDIEIDADTGLIAIAGGGDANGKVDFYESDGLILHGSRLVPGGLASVDMMNGFMYAAVNPTIGSNGIVVGSLSQWSTPTVLMDFGAPGPFSAAAGRGALIVYDSGRDEALVLDIATDPSTPLLRRKIQCAGQPPIGTTFPSGGGAGASMPSEAPGDPGIGSVSGIARGGGGCSCCYVCEVPPPPGIWPPPDDPEMPFGGFCVLNCGMNEISSGGTNWGNGASGVVNIFSSVDAAVAVGPMAPQPSMSVGFADQPLPSPTPETKNGDPIVMRSGALLESLDVVSLADPLMPIDFSLRYHSRVDYDGPIGRNWRHSFDDRLMPAGQDFDVLVDGLRLERFAFNPATGSWTGSGPGADVITYHASSGDATYERRSKYGIVREYDASGLLKAIRDRNGNTTTLSYRCSRLTNIISPSGRWISLNYNASERVASIRDFTGRTFEFGYDVRGRLTSVRFPGHPGHESGTERRYEYSSSMIPSLSDNIVRVVDAKGDTITLNTFDGSDRLTAQSWGSSTCTLSFGTAGSLDETTYVQYDGTTIKYRFDSAGREVEEEVFTRGLRVGEPASYKTTKTYWSSGLLKSVTFPSGRTEELSYDAGGNIVQKRVMPTPTSSQFIDVFATFEPTFNQMTSSTDQLGNVENHVYDGFGQRIRTDHPTVSAPVAQTASTTYAYDSKGRMTRMTDPEGRITDYTYATSGVAEGFLIAETRYPAAGESETTSFERDRLGRIVSLTQPSGTTETTAWNGRDLVDSRTTADGAVFTYLYDANGRRALEVAPNRTTGGIVDPACPSFTKATTWDARGLETSSTSQIDAATFATTLFTYSALGYPATTIDPVGNVTAYEYDERGYLMRVRRAVGTADEIVESHDYDGDGRLIRSVDARGLLTTRAYDGFGRIVRVDRPAVAAYEIDWSNRGEVVGVRHIDTKSTPSTSDDVTIGHSMIDYDERGRIYRLRRRVSGTTYASNEFRWDRSGQLLESTDSGGSTTTYQTDGTGRHVSITDALGNRIVDEYAGGRIVGKRAIDNISGVEHTLIEQEIEYDIAGNQHVVRQKTVGANPASSRSRTIDWDSRGNVVADTDELGRVTRYAYDGLDRLRTVRRPHDGHDIIETMVFDAAGRMTSRTDTAGETVQWTYDRLDRITRVDWPGSKFETFEYDESSNVVRMTDRRGTIVDQTFDALDRLIDRTITLSPGVGGATFEAYGYDAADRLTTAANDIGMSLSRAYNDVGALLSETQNGRTVTSTYGVDGVRTARTAPNGETIAYGRDALDRATSYVRQGATPVNIGTVNYSGALRAISGAFGNGVNWTATYDDYARPSGQIFAKAGTIVSGWQSTMDVRNNILALKKFPQAKYDVLGYDDLDRLATRIIDSTNAAGMGTNGGSESWTIDDRGNRTLSVATSGGGTSSMTSYVGGVENTYASVASATYTYDANGNLLQNGNRNFKYDYANRLIEVATLAGTVIARYDYDAVGRRAKKTVYGAGGGIRNLVYDGIELIEERSPNGSYVAEFVHADGIDSPISIEVNGNRYWLHADHLGSIRHATNSSGAVVESYEYGAFGETTIKNASNQIITKSAIGNPFGYTGQVYDAETGLYHFRARAYSPTLGRFLQLDPAGFIDGMNRYQYALGNPIIYLDPLGLGFWSRIGEALASAAQAAAVALVTVGATAIVAAAVGAAAIPAVGAYVAAVAIGTLVSELVSQPVGEFVKETVKKHGGTDGEAAFLGGVVEVSIDLLAGRRTDRMMNPPVPRTPSGGNRRGYGNRRKANDSAASSQKPDSNPREPSRPKAPTTKSSTEKAAQRALEAEEERIDDLLEGAGLVLDHLESFDMDTTTTKKPKCGGGDVNDR